jgi:hypothetical protein
MRVQKKKIKNAKYSQRSVISPTHVHLKERVNVTAVPHILFSVKIKPLGIQHPIDFLSGYGSVRSISCFYF